jgi:hypothetical protein
MGEPGEASEANARKSAYDSRVGMHGGDVGSGRY